MHFTDSMSRSLSELVGLVKQLRDEVGQQRSEISHLRQFMENCAGCRQTAQHTEQIRESCQVKNPCYPGNF